MKYSGCHERLRAILDDMESVKGDLPDATNISGINMHPNSFKEGLYSEMEDLHKGTKTQIARRLLKKLKFASTQTDFKFVDPTIFAD